MEGFNRLLLFSVNVSSSSEKMSYPWWKRLWRIFKFLQRSRKKRKQELRQRKNKKKEERRKEKKFLRRKRWRKFKVVIKSILGLKKPSLVVLEERRQKKLLKSWKKRKRQRIRRAVLKGFFKRPIASHRKQLLVEKYQAEQAFEKYRRKRRYRFILKRNKEIILNFLKGKGLPQRKKRKAPSIWKQWLHKDQITISVHSLLLFLISYFFIQFMANLSMAITSLLFEYKTVIYYYKIEFLVDYDAWFADSIKTIFSAGPVIAFIIAVLSLIIYSLVYLESGILKTLLLWSILHGSNKIIGGTLIGNLLGKGFGYVIMYLYYSDTGKLIMSLLMILAATVIGTVSTKYWIMSANSYYKFSKPNNRPLFILSQVFIPYVFGAFLIYLIEQPESLRYDNFVNIFMIFMILPPVMLNKYYQEFYFENEEKTIKPAYKIIVFSIIFLVLYRVLLDIGLRIG